jgi:hypothetical protein
MIILRFKRLSRLRTSNNYKNTITFEEMMKKWTNSLEVF